MRWFGEGIALAAAALLGIALAGGCDGTSDDSVPVIEDVEESRPAPAIADDPPPPTTQELVSGPYKSLPLVGMPLSIYVPQSWEIETYGNGSVNIVKGYAPNGEVRINLSHFPRTTQEKLDIMVEGARKEMAAEPQFIKKVDLNKRGDIQVLERQSLSRTPLPPDPANPAAPSGPIMRWTITAFVPAGQEFDTYELNFITLPVKQFEADQEFLRKMVDSLIYDPTAAGAAGTTTSPTPTPGTGDADAQPEKQAP